MISFSPNKIIVEIGAGDARLVTAGAQASVCWCLLPKPRCPLETWFGNVTAIGDVARGARPVVCWCKRWSNRVGARGRGGFSGCPLGWSLVHEPWLDRVPVIGGVARGARLGSGCPPQCLVLPEWWSDLRSSRYPCSGAWLGMSASVLTGVRALARYGGCV